MPTSIPTPVKALLDGLNAEPVTIALSERLQAYISSITSSDDATSANNDFQALLMSLCQKLIGTATESEAFKPLLATLLNNLRHLRLDSARACIDR